MSSKSIITTAKCNPRVFNKEINHKAPIGTFWHCNKIRQGFRKPTSVNYDLRQVFIGRSWCELGKISGCPLNGQWERYTFPTFIRFKFKANWRNMRAVYVPYRLCRNLVLLSRFRRNIPLVDISMKKIQRRNRST